MTYFEIVKTIYLNNGSDELLKYELLSNGTEEVTVATAYVEIKTTCDNLPCSVWSKLADITLDHLGAKRQGFQKMVEMDQRPGKSISSAIDECKKHRAHWRR
ncbi:MULTISPECIES: hypothetical protein [unclassified Serratia (in: enterobacteria)]|uniref:hypothetical protein n=1 Tax=unclassified Serratia (in: enterobacteria) TaxID=2647522 RepID=UPI0018A92C4B|nr:MULTISPECIES: hypothetical protein [unclassified Serratia (in: enterobacteria)]